MSIATCFGLGKELCELLGLNPADTRSFTIESDATEGVIYVKAIIYLRDERGRAVAERLSRFQLCEREDSPPESLHDAEEQTLGAPYGRAVPT